MFRKIFIGILLFSFLYCKNSSNNDNSSGAIAVLALSKGSGTSTSSSSSKSYLTSVPSVLKQSDLTATGKSIKETVLDTDATISNLLKGFYAPPRYSIKMASDIMAIVQTFIDLLESASVKTIPSGTIVEVKDDELSTATVTRKKIIRISNSSTFGSGGKKMEIWWKSTGSDTLRDGKKQIEFEYTISSSGTVDGIAFFRIVDAKDTSATVTNPPIGRIEFRKDSLFKTTVIQLEKFTDFKNNKTGKGAFYIKEDLTTGIVTIDGGYLNTGLDMPFYDSNYPSSLDTVNWGTTTKRVYLFSAAGSDTYNKGVVNVIIPQVGAESASPYGNSTATSKVSWGLGEEFTSALMYVWNKRSNSCSPSSATTILGCINYWFTTSLTTSSNQADLQSALNTMKSSSIYSTNTDVKTNVNNIQAITGLKNPVYFLRTTNPDGSTSANSLIGQENTTGITTTTVPGVGDVTQYATLEKSLKSNTRSCSTEDGGTFSSSGIDALSISLGTSICPITDHKSITTISKWTLIDETAPTATIVADLK